VYFLQNEKIIIAQLFDYAQILGWWDEIYVERDESEAVQTDLSRWGASYVYVLFLSD
jgi:hypothetical protein